MAQKRFLTWLVLVGALVVSSILFMQPNVRADQGSLGEWQLTTSMNSIRYAEGVAAVKGFIYAIGGGTTSPAPMNTVEGAPILGNGSLGDWSSKSSMNYARFYYSVVSAGAYIYAIGGTPDGGWTILDSVERALVNDDGTLEQWEQTTPMLRPLAGHGAIVVNHYLYVIGGRGANNANDTEFYDEVERAEILADGTLGEWELMSSLNTARSGFAVAAANNYLYVFGGGDIVHGPFNTIERAHINLDGSLGNWELIGTLPGTRFDFTALSYGNAVYLLGGRDSGDCGNVGIKNVDRSIVDENGNLGIWQAQNSLVENRSVHGSVLYGYYMYVLGGTGECMLSQTNNTVEYTNVALVNTPTPSQTATITQTPTNTMTPTSTPTLTPSPTPDNSLPTIESLSINGGAMTSTSTNVILGLQANDPTDGVAEMSFSNDGLSWSSWEDFAVQKSWFLENGDGQKSVHARVRDYASNVSSVFIQTIELDTSVDSEFTLSINAGALYTNRTDVSLTVSARPLIAQMQVSNDGGFAGAMWQPYRSVLDWVITSYDGSVIPRTVYVRYKDVDGIVYPAVSDDIILDVQAPTGSVTININSASPVSEALVNLKLKASDDLSGVGGMRLSNRSDMTGAVWETFTNVRAWKPGKNQVVYVQYRDNAENASKLYTATTCSESPDKPKLVSPSSDATVNAGYVTLDWKDVKCGTRFTVMVKEDSPNGKTVSKMKKGASSTFVTRALPSNKSYYWQVKVCNKQLCTLGDWWKFQTQ